ncbi:MAG: hypothetical protein ACJ77K_11460 [Bacteroidia bacterium]
MRKLNVLFIVILLTGCIRSVSKLPWNIHGATEITLELNPLTTDTALQNRIRPLTDPVIVQKLCDEINNADDAGPWKGAGWHTLTIRKGDQMWSFKTNGEVFGPGNSGDFYKFSSSSNIVEEYFHIDTLLRID